MIRRKAEAAEARRPDDGFEPGFSDGAPERCRRLILAMGPHRDLPCRAVFLMPSGCKPSDLIRQLGCDLAGSGVVPTRHDEKTNVPGLYVAGDASRRVQFAVVAAAEGAMAAFAINTELLREDTRQPVTSDRVGR